MQTPEAMMSFYGTFIADCVQLFVRICMCVYHLYMQLAEITERCVHVCRLCVPPVQKSAEEIRIPWRNQLPKASDSFEDF